MGVLRVTVGSSHGTNEPLRFVPSALNMLSEREQRVWPSCSFRLTGQRLSRKEHLMKSPTVAVVLAIILAFAVVGVCAFATADTRVAPKSAVVAAGFAAILGLRSSVGDTVEGRVAVTHRRAKRGAPPAPADLQRYRSVLAIQVSVDDLLDRSRRAMQERTYL
jgi:hypothetical protein